MTGRTEVRLEGTEHGDRLLEAGFTISTGWDEELARQLYEQAQEPLSAAFPNDKLIRFPSPEAATDWYGRKERVVYALSRMGQLGAAIWFSSDHYRTAERTSSIRIYKEAKRAMAGRAFIDFAHIHHEQVLGFTSDVWIETEGWNITLQHIFQRAGYRHAHDETIEQGRVRLIRPGIATMLVESAE